MKVKSVKINTAKSKKKVADIFVDEGFLLEGEAALPDIDSDYQSDRRQEVKDYLKSKYDADGTHNCFAAGTFTTLKIKAVIKDVGRINGVPSSLTNYMTATIPDKEAGMSFTEFFRTCLKNKKLKKFAQDYPRVIEDMRTLMFQPKATSVHASAYIITPKFKNGKRVECFDYLPIRMMDGQLVSEYDGYSVEEVGLLKLDVLSTKELMKLGGALREINENFPERVAEIMKPFGGGKLTMEVIHTHLLDDKRAYDLLGEGHTQNVFQFSSSGMTKLLKEIQPDNINDLIAANALYRPAAMTAGAHEDYVIFKRGEAEPIYDWGTYDALKNTYGLIVLQEQVMNIAKDVGGFKPAEAAALMKVVSKKKMDKVKAMKKLFMSGAGKKGCPSKDAESIWNKIEASGSYLFNLSHAAAYGLAAYDGAWIKANFPTAFYTIGMQESDDDDDIKNLMGEMVETSNCRIMPPDVNESETKFAVNYKTDEIFWSISRIKFVGAKAVQTIIDDRNEFGSFKSFDDFFIRIQARTMAMKEKAKSEGGRFTNPINIRVMKNMVLAGCFDKCNEVQTTPERYFVVERLFELSGGAGIPEKEFPLDGVGLPHFWVRKQIEVSGFGAIDYRRIYNGSEAKKEMKKISYLSLKEALDQDNESRRFVTCATVIEVTEMAGKGKQSGKEYICGKLMLQQNNEVMEYSLWNDAWSNNRPKLIHSKDKIVVISGVIKYNDYSKCNVLSGGSKTVIEVI